MALTEEQKNQIVKHFSVKVFREAACALIEEEQSLSLSKFEAAPKASHEEEAFVLTTAKGGFRALESLKQKILRLSEADE